MDDKSRLAAFVSTAKSLTGHPVEFKGNDVLHDYAGFNPEAAKVMGWPDEDNAILLDKNQTAEEQIENVIHEVVEEFEMKYQGKNYHDAHVDALKAEETIKTPEQLVARIEKIIGHKLTENRRQKAKYSITAHKGNRKIHKSVAGLGRAR